MTEFNDEWFYGSPKNKKKKEEDPDDSFENEGSLKKTPTRAQSRRDSLVEQSLGCFETFSRQRLAIEFLKSSEQLHRNLRIFSYEFIDKTEGERRYLVTTLSRFWLWYKVKSQRHIYELLYEEFPCRLYFDLEFYKDANPDINEEVMYSHFCEVVRDELKSTFDISITPEKNFLVLDSSSESKFSAHVICHFDDGSLFPNSASLRRFCHDLTEKLKASSPHKLVDSSGEKEVTIIDPAVYTKNRNFRLFLSSKLGSDRVLKVSKLCKFYEKMKPTDDVIFYDSLCIPANFDKYPLIKIEEKVGDPITKNSNSSSSKYDSSREGCGPSPFPQLDDFILMILRKWKSNVFIRQWKVHDVDGNPETVTYYPGNCRFCFNINREHKSNGSYWTVDLKRGSFVQKCFDPECRGARSNDFPLPDFMKNALKLKEVQHQDSFDENDSFSEGNNDHYEYFTNWDQVFES
ncbi:unnamed protein product [Auanema sp. JU1783]|nr:unnamed protein product [Auanema sp. JU1783]